MHHCEAVESFYTSHAWRKAREAVLKDRGGLCELCFRKGIVEPAVHVHHKVPLTVDNIDDPFITLDGRNLLALCEECHAEQHRTKRWRCDAMGHINLGGD